MLYVEVLKNRCNAVGRTFCLAIKDWLISHIEKQDRDGYGSHIKAR